jgi:hypothetical protein
MAASARRPSPKSPAGRRSAPTVCSGFISARSAITS